MITLAVVNVLNSVPPGAPVPEGGVGFEVPSLVAWAVAVGLVVAVAVLGRRMNGRLQAWWRRRLARLRRAAPRAVAESLTVPSL